ncbi:MAG: hypothetical protein JEZ06_23215 [Anaerolineaceae bacterium]|nr:hypothetical protein [Anaerolineaceae bacterium]
MSRIGTFLLIIGIILLLLYVLSDFAQTPNFSYLLFSMLFFTCGFILKRMHPNESNGSNTRFRLIRSLGKRSPVSKKKEQKQNE